MLTTIDLFCGAGGLTEGFRQAGFECLYGNDVSHSAIETFRCNHPNAWADATPIQKIDPRTVRRKLKLKKGDLAAITGGPPCQGFSINAPDRFLEDPRNSLFRHYIRFIEEFEPQSVIFENVPGMLSLADGHVLEQVTKQLQAHGYHLSTGILFAAHYGVPQARWRLIIAGSRQTPAPDLPEPTHYATGRANFKGARTFTHQLVPLQRQLLEPAVTVGDALSDLPRLAIGEGGEVVQYTDRPKTEYAKLMRKGVRETYNHHAGKLSIQNMERLKYIKPGGSWRDIPFELLPAGMKKARKSDHTKRYGRLKDDGLSGTIMTKCDPHWGSVFLPDQDRALTVREAARLQSFPDCYRFCGPRVSQYEQVGNAVPVLMAKAIAEALLRTLTGNPLERDVWQSESSSFSAIAR